MPDVISAIKQDHRRVEDLFDQYTSSGAAADKEAVFEQIRTALAQHAAAEEILVYPTVRTTSGRDDAKHAIDEHQTIKRILADLDKLDASDADHAAKVTELQQAVMHHVEEEEGQLLPDLAAGTEPKRLEQMGDLFESMKPLLPTHSHPNVPGTATAQLMAGPLASVADRIRDFVSG
jgi:hemerythrin superfamily protein